MEWIEFAQVLVINSVSISVGMIVMTYLMPYVAGKTMIRGFMKAGGEVINEDVRTKLMDTLKEPSIRNLIWEIISKIMTNKEVMKAIKGNGKVDVKESDKIEL